MQPSQNVQPARRSLKEPGAKNAAGRRSGRWCALWVLLTWFAMASLGGSPRAVGQGIDREYTLKAVYLYKLATYVRWPEGAFADASSPFVMGILGPDLVSPGLRKIAAVKKIGKREIKIRKYKQIEEIRNCQMLFISRAVDGETQQAALKQLSGRNILFVGETKDFLKHGGVVDFVVRENRIHLYISTSAYEREGLEISANFLRVATVVN